MLSDMLIIWSDTRGKIKKREKLEQLQITLKHHAMFLVPKKFPLCMLVKQDQNFEE